MPCAPARRSNAPIRLAEKLHAVEAAQAAAETGATWLLDRQTLIPIFSAEGHDCHPATAWLQGRCTRCRWWHWPAPIPPPEAEPQGH